VLLVRNALLLETCLPSPLLILTGTARTTTAQARKGRLAIVYFASILTSLDDRNEAGLVSTQPTTLPITILIPRCLCNTTLVLARVDREHQPRGIWLERIASACIASVGVSHFVRLLRQSASSCCWSGLAWLTRHMLFEFDSTTCNRQIQEDVVSLLTRDMVVHPAIQVRVMLLALYNTLVRRETASSPPWWNVVVLSSDRMYHQIEVLPTQDLEKRILPAVITLSNDMDLAVRKASIRPLGNFAVSVDSPGVREPSVHIRLLNAPPLTRDITRRSRLWSASMFNSRRS